MKFPSVILTLAIFLTAYIGDYVVFSSKYSNNQVFRAFADNSVHSSVGFFSSLLFFSNQINVTNEVYIYNTFLCTIVSSLIDVDHFIEAKSFHFADLANVQRRGVFHCTTLWIIIILILLIYVNFIKKYNVYILICMLVIAFTSHHIRDGNRRGLWFFPYGSTPPINKYVYILLICTIPTLLAYIYHYYKPVVKYTALSRGIV